MVDEPSTLRDASVDSKTFVIAEAAATALTSVNKSTATWAATLMDSKILLR